MQAVEHQGFGLKYLTVAPDGYSPETTYPLIIMLHGFGANMQDLAGLAPMINQHGYVYACPNAPLAFDLGGGHAGWGWMAPRGMSTPEQVQSAEDLLAGFFDEVFEQFKTEPGKAVLLGFSQGGGMTYRCGLERPTAFAGLAALSATLPDEELLAHKLPQDREQAIFIAHGLYDPMIALDRAQAAKSFLESSGYSPEYHEYEMAHEISADVLRDLAPWLARVLPPLDQPPD